MAFGDSNSLGLWIAYFAGILIAFHFHKSLHYHMDRIMLITLCEQGETTALSLLSETHCHGRAWKMSTNFPFSIAFLVALSAVSLSPLSGTFYTQTLIFLIIKFFVCFFWGTDITAYILHCLPFFCYSAYVPDFPGHLDDGAHHWDHTFSSSFRSLLNVLGWVSVKLMARTSPSSAEHPNCPPRLQFISEVHIFPVFPPVSNARLFSLR